MKTISATVVATLFAASVSASDVYHGLEQGNSDLQGGASSSGAITASQPSIGSDFDHYQGWADGNHDLFGDVRYSSLGGRSGPANVYRGFAGGNPDL